MTDTCTRPDRTGRPDTCLQALAGGWITVMDLCGACTSRLMAALDAVSPEPLSWHQGYRDRAGPVTWSNTRNPPRPPVGERGGTRCWVYWSTGVTFDRT